MCSKHNAHDVTCIMQVQVHRLSWLGLCHILHIDHEQDCTMQGLRYMRHTCISDSIARSLATATVSPRGSKLAWATQLASIAPLALLLAAVMTYNPPETRAKDLATSGAMEAFILAIDSFLVRTCASLVPASSIPYTAGHGSTTYSANDRSVTYSHTCCDTLLVCHSSVYQQSLRRPGNRGWAENKWIVYATEPPGKLHRGGQCNCATMMADFCQELFVMFTTC